MLRVDIITLLFYEYLFIIILIDTFVPMKFAKSISSNVPTFSTLQRNYTNHYYYIIYCAGNGTSQELKINA